jgi:23S rRNA G2445 N2-methylase RlmL
MHSSNGPRTCPGSGGFRATGAFPVNGRSVKSQLSSVPACQRTVKKAIVERLMRGHATRELPETGVRTIIEVSILENVASITLDTSGDGLHKRGYRDIVGDAALKETMAAGLVLLSVWNADRPLVDPFCGTGTIVIEAAMIGLGLAPGRSRSFDAENWAWIGKDVFDRERAAGHVPAREKLAYTIHGSDVSETALALARRHAKRAGVARHIHFQKRAFADLQSKAEYGCIVTNPPYGERMGEDEAIERLYRSFPEVLRRLPTWSHHILTARPRSRATRGAAGNATPQALQRADRVYVLPVPWPQAGDAPGAGRRRGRERECGRGWKR